MPQIEFTTQEFKTSPSQYFGLHARRWHSRYWWTIAIPVTILAILSILDIRWLMINIMLFLIVRPIIIGGIYFSYTLTPWATKVIPPKYVRFVEGRNITLHFTPNEFHPEPPEPSIIQWSRIRKIYIQSKLLAIIIDDDEKILPIPIDAIPEDIDIFHLTNSQTIKENM